MDAAGAGFAVILRNRGSFAVGSSMRLALASAFIVEEAAIVAVNALAVSDRLRLMTE
jgi:ribulose-5-phosphate 4-epimerase/fuculose-1-phosphate aldolase